MLLWFDGFDETAGLPSDSYFVSVPSNATGVPGRFGGHAINLSNCSIGLPISPSGSSIYVGFALYLPVSGYAAVTELLGFSDGTMLKVDEKYGAFSLYEPGGTLIGSIPANPAVIAAWTYVELGITFGSPGTFTIRLNGALAASGSISSSASISLVTIYETVSSGLEIDDYYICDGSGTTNNTFLGNQKVVTYMPSAAGRVTQFTPEGESANYECVDEIPSDGDTTYVQSQTPGNVDCYDLALISGQTAPTGAIAGVKVTSVARIDNAGSRTLESGIGNGTSESYGNAVGLSGSYVSYPSFFAENPFTSAPFAPGDLASLQAAIQVTT
jgi:hypothetical protein